MTSAEGRPAGEDPNEFLAFGTRVRRGIQEEIRGAIRDIDDETAPLSVQDATEQAFTLLLEQLRREYNKGKPFRPARLRPKPRGKRPTSAD